jgi:hypothetical protein
MPSNRPMQRRTLLIHTLGFGTALTLAPGVLLAAEADSPNAQPAGYRVSTAQMQEAIGQRFPRRYPVQGLLNLEVQTPKLTMLPAENRLRAEMPVEAAGPALNRSHQGSFEVDFGLRYEASDRTLRAHQLRLSKLNFPSLQPSVVALLNTYAPTLGDELLKEVVLHRLEPKDLAPLDNMGMQPGAITVTATGLVVGMVLKPL